MTMCLTNWLENLFSFGVSNVTLKLTDAKIIKCLFIIMETNITLLFISSDEVPRIVNIAQYKRNLNLIVY